MTALSQDDLLTGEYARIPRRDDAFMLPRGLDGEPGRFVVDATWGHVAPMVPVAGVEPVGELEVVAHLRAGGRLVDTRLERYFRKGTIPGAVLVPHEEVLDHRDAFDPEADTVLFCNGPQCAATPDALEQLVAAGHPAARLKYYRGGIHDWVTLGLPLARS